MTHPPRPFPALALAMALTLVACGQDAESPTPPPATPSPTASPTPSPTTSPSPSPTANEAGTPSGWQRIDVAEQGFTIAVPDDWDELSPADIGESGVIQQLIEANPDAAAALEQAAAAIETGQIALFAFDTDAETEQSGFAANLNVINVGPVEGGADQAAEEVAEAIRQQIPVIGEVETETVALAAGDAAVVRYEWEVDAGEGAPTTVSVSQYAIVADSGTGFILSMSAASASAEQYRETFRQIAESFREATG